MPNADCSTADWAAESSPLNDHHSKWRLECEPGKGLCIPLTEFAERVRQTNIGLFDMPARQASIPIMGLRIRKWLKVKRRVPLSYPKTSFPINPNNQILPYHLSSLGARAGPAGRGERAREDFPALLLRAELNYTISRETVS